MSSSAAQLTDNEFHTPMKAELKALQKYVHWNNSQITHTVSMPHITVWDILNKCPQPHHNESHCHEHHNLLSKKNIEKLVAKTTKNWQRRTLTWKELETLCGFDCSQWTIWWAMNAVEYHKCKTCHHPYILEITHQKWLDFILKYQHFMDLKWSNWIFSNEMAFCTDTQATKYVICTVDEWQHCECIQNQYCLSWTIFTAWEAVGHNWKSSLIILEKGTEPWGKFSQKNYIKQILEPVILIFFEKCHWAGYMDLIMYEDGNKTHGLADNVNSAVQTKQHLNINVFHVSLSSSDFNIIENVWRIIKSRLKRCLFTRKEDLKWAVLEEWDRLQPHEWMKYIQKMSQRLAQCIQRHGFATEY